MIDDLHIDLETFSTVDLIKCGTYRYAEEAEIIMLQYAFNDEPVTVVDVLSGEPIPQRVLDALSDPLVTKWAHNANFERTLISACLGIPTPPSQWRCTAVWASHLGLPSKLGELTEVLKLGDKGKLKIGAALIRKFCVPKKPPKKLPKKHNERTMRVRNLPIDYPDDWEEFKRYGFNDVEAERELHRRFKPYPMPASEWEIWEYDQEINDEGIRIDTPMVRNAIELATRIKAGLMERAKEISGLENPNSVKQLLKWLEEEDVIVSDMTKKTVESILDGGTSNQKVLELMQLRQQIAKSSVTKYEAMARAVCRDGRLRGMFKFNGAGRTSRWAGQIVQMQNLPSKGLIKDIETGHTLLLQTPDLIPFFYDDVPLVLSSLIRTAFLPDEGDLLAVADFSSIEARKAAWYANEEWRVKLFTEGGKLYETSAEKMFKLPSGSVTKKDPNRQKGKVAELALGYQGWENALITMGALEMGIPLEELAPIASAWREANQGIVEYWWACEDAAFKAVKTKSRVPVLTKYQQTPLIHYECDGNFLMCELPSGRKLYYVRPRIARNDRDKMAVSIEGMNNKTKRWERSWLYGGLLFENICQASARDNLKDALLAFRDDELLRKVRLHVHDEAGVSAPADRAQEALTKMEEIMARAVPWFPGLLLKGDGFVTPYYRKDDD